MSKLPCLIWLSGSSHRNRVPFKLVYSNPRRWRLKLRIEHFETERVVFLSFSILRDPGADSWVVRKSKRPTVYKNEREAPGILLLNDQFRNQLKFLYVIGESESSPLPVILSWLLIRRCSATNCLIACSPFIYLSASCRGVSLGLRGWSFSHNVF